MKNDEASDQLRRYDREARKFADIYGRVRELLKGFGRPDYVPGEPPGDYSVHGDYNGYPQVVVFVTDLKMLRPPVVEELQRLIKSYPGWQISMTVGLRAHYHEWPHMGLYIRPDEIIDGLQRQYFPKEYQDLEYKGARRGTARD